MATPDANFRKQQSLMTTQMTTLMDSIAKMTTQMTLDDKPDNGRWQPK
jgi:hypothetical protein